MGSAPSKRSHGENGTVTAEDMGDEELVATTQATRKRETAAIQSLQAGVRVASTKWEEAAAQSGQAGARMANADAPGWSRYCSIHG